MLPPYNSRAVACLKTVYPMSALNEESRYKLLKLLHENPDMNQRQIASELGISLGKVNFCLKALIEKGWVKAGNFSKSPNKRAYAYLLTFRGIEEKTQVTKAFLQRKQKEYEELKTEIEELKNEANDLIESGDNR
jgi:EPS-associated MarR family transcriptional regulator